MTFHFAHARSAAREHALVRPLLVTCVRVLLFSRRTLAGYPRVRLHEEAEPKDLGHPKGKGHESDRGSDRGNYRREDRYGSCTLGSQGRLDREDNIEKPHSPPMTAKRRNTPTSPCDDVVPALGRFRDHPGIDFRPKGRVFDPAFEVPQFQHTSKESSTDSRHFLHSHTERFP